MSRRRGPNRNHQPHPTPGTGLTQRVLRQRETRRRQGLDGHSSTARGTWGLEAFFADQDRRIQTVTNAHVARVRDARKRLREADERATRREALTEFSIEVRGQCGSDAHADAGDGPVLL